MNSRLAPWIILAIWLWLVVMANRRVLWVLGLIYAGIKVA
jgi:hypothetical protein